MTALVGSHTDGLAPKGVVVWSRRRSWHRAVPSWPCYYETD